MPKYLLDTNILIYYLNGDKTAIEFVDKNIDMCAMSIISYLEVLVYPYDEEEEKIVRDFLNLFRVYAVEMDIVNSAITAYRNKKINIADNLIGSTAKSRGLTLVTRNVADFRAMALEILDPYAKRDEEL